MSNENYNLELNMFKDIFGGPKLLISTHMSKLLSSEPVCSISELKYLKKKLDEAEIQVRS